MDGPQAILDPPDRSPFNGGGGGVRNEAGFSGGPYPNVSSIHCIRPPSLHATSFLHAAPVSSSPFIHSLIRQSYPSMNKQT
jgi:hypothetical protein